MTRRAFEDAFNLLCGDKIGSGISRDVFECRIRPDLVVKVETNENWRTFSNAYEMKFWCDNQYAPKIAKWLAPCEYMSPDGRIMLQKRVRSAHPNDSLPAMIPAFLTDIKRENFGWLGTQLVCVDYATTIDSINTRLRKVVW